MLGRFNSNSLQKHPQANPEAGDIEECRAGM
jgi:hypothetical protein